jgi:hypothetical protein
VLQKRTLATRTRTASIETVTDGTVAAIATTKIGEGAETMTMIRTIAAESVNASVSVIDCGLRMEGRQVVERTTVGEFSMVARAGCME